MRMMPESVPDAWAQRDFVPVNAVIGFLKRDQRGTTDL